MKRQDEKGYYDATKEAKSISETEAELANRDPITGAPGAHPVGVGVGAAGGGAAGAAIGAVAGPIGAAVGAGVGAVAGGLAGKAVAEKIDPTIEDAYWRENYLQRPYVETGVYYVEYEPAYRYGWENASKLSDKTFEESEAELERNWDKARGRSSLTWGRAKEATRDAWDRIRNHPSKGPEADMKNPAYRSCPN